MLFYLSALNIKTKPIIIFKKLYTKLEKKNKKNKTKNKKLHYP